jgi:predicted acetyltransferase
VSNDVTLEPATRADAGVLANLLELYVHDLSEIFPQARIGADGRFGYEHLPKYWAEPDRRFAFLIRAGGALAGFALAMRGSPATDDPDDLDVAEFFVLRGHRRAGVGRLAAPLLWDRIPGSWVIRCSMANRPGLPFWESVVRGYTGGAYAARELPGSPDPWRVFTFRSASGERR